jgi:Ca-activated chloride channel family protein
VSELSQQFHFLRPLWLLGLVPVALLLLLAWRHSRSGRGWRQVISSELLPYLLDPQATSAQRNLLPLVAAGWLASVIALAGPSWEQIPQPVERNDDALVILYDLSLSMLAEDLSPSRLERSRRKLVDLLAVRKEGLTALIAYAGDAHVVSPLSDDNRTISNLLPALEPGIMPLPGSEPVAAVEEALVLFQSAGVSKGRILLVTDGMTRGDAETIAKLLRGGSYQMSVLGVGTNEGGPIPLSASGFLKDRDGDIVIPRLDSDTLKAAALDGGGYYADITLDDRDLDSLLPTSLTMEASHSEALGRSVDTWHDRGYLLALVLIPLLLGSFRRGWLLFIPGLLLGSPAEVYAVGWQDLWLTADQQAQQLLEQGEPAAAANRFNSPDWAAAAHYRAEDYDAALEQYQRSESSTGFYNQGNAAAHTGDLPAAIAAYEKALKLEPELEDARFNKELLEKLLQQEQQQQQSGQDGEQGDKQEQQQSNDQQGQEGQEGQEGQDQNSQQADSQQQDADPGEQAEQQDDQKQRQARAEDANEEDGEDQQAAMAQATQDDEEQKRDQATEAWLRRIPDDPGGLLRRKFQYQSQQRNQQRRNNDEIAW